MTSGVLELVSRYVEEHWGCTAVEVSRAVPTATDDALRRLERAGFIARYQVRRETHFRSFKPYRCDDATGRRERERTHE